MPTINRVLSEENLGNFIKDFKNLIKIVNNSQGELDLSIRDNYLNVYYKGNSLARIRFTKSGVYRIEIHKKFFEGTKADSTEFYKVRKESGDYYILTLDERKSPLRFLQKAHIDQFCGRIKQVNYGEEIVFEQALITDNLGREDLIIIDRQITDTKLRGKRLDLLALKQIKSGEREYHFLVLEVKLGNNPELKQDVANQLKGYLNHIKYYIGDYQQCYQTQFVQKKAMGVLKNVSYETITIADQVKGMVIVGGYSKIAQKSIKELKILFPDIQIKQFIYEL
ncbi:hypothetical protein ACFLYP_02195 [Chloroflexota bacterium]